ncbi:cytochrome c [Sediminibacterium sp.]|jgi:mono/diheme cytochrome c family protein|uniref:c-type cytochrome n=1 Tax=Sediminibacterium sp. TaxID=1917865 RepID=UPI000BDAEB84|nr:cytochrome c [Sediminibacterium sp.]OYY11493.1 MAG: quinol:cytochrome C oxidoreductase [Sphingobacteriia bacterium 35-36-14]OYZ54332.1 MAG: quinol:cytochrome C oxidoreductase [Sphingobacteriia bacterium 24-36-13]OZA64209.1 MAG: quinol:cytochrome C oxidoreductase [Sphingobacteriia bacterium 39-36-14]MDO8996882.1 cytochrome c [Sediminibacterium sp.]MDP1974222.1 cytochrome c [Sediminibacterium sp.]
MKNTLIIASLTAVVALTACSDVKRTPGTIYMPDMAYSRAYESYADHSNLAEKGINYNSRPVVGTISREEDMPFHIPMDQPGDTTNYTASKAVPNPYDTLSKTDMEEAERLYLINCGICHGDKLNGNGPLYKDGAGPYAAKPAALVGDAKYEAMPAGQMFYSVAYGKNLMGSYASQLSRKQRWQVIAYIKAKQQASKAKAAPAPAADATATTK